MTRLFLCEKPSQGRDIARVLGATARHDGYLTGSGVTVTWCFGHLLEMAPPEAYDPAFKRWSLDTLPIIPADWRLEIKPAARQQFQVVKRLLEGTREVVIATDADREGETIAREVMALCGYQGKVSRLWLAALDEASIRKALGAMLPGAKTEALYQAGLARARADWLIGMNLTRASTVAGRAAGYDGVLSVGRVQTPTLALVVERDRAIEAFKPVPYFDLQATFEVAAGRFQAKWLPPEAVSDAEGRCLRRDAALQVAQRVQGRTRTIVKAATFRVKEATPLPLDLSTLQQEASKRWGVGAQEVLDVAQSLYETHKATTYPRTDCPYLPESQHAEATQVLAALRASDAGIRAHIDAADPRLRSRAWSDSKITAHHAIIPTAQAVDLRKMNEAERRIYELVWRRYLAQFFPAHEYDRTEVEVQVAVDRFEAVGRVARVAGWRQVLAAVASEDGEDGPKALPTIHEGETARAIELEVQDKQTTPPARFTEGTLVAAMKHIGHQVTDPDLKRILKETAGIGTEATRAGIIQTLFKRGFLAREGKKHLMSTPFGRALIDALPFPVKDPGLTALWEQALEDIAQGRGSLASFVARQVEWVRTLLHAVRHHPRPEGNGRPSPGATRAALPDHRRRSGKGVGRKGRGRSGSARGLRMT